MKGVLLFLVLIALVACQPPHEFNREERMKRRKEFQKQLADCILKDESISADLKKKIEDNKDDDLRKVLHLYISKLDTNDREIIRKCRRELFSKMREIHRGKFQERFNHSFPFHHRGGNNNP